MSGTNSPHDNRAADARDICTVEPAAESGAAAASAHSDFQPRQRSALTRRGFLKTTGALAGAAAIAGGAGALTALADGNSEGDGKEKHFTTSCQVCCHSDCCQDVTVRDGKIVKIRKAETPDCDYPNMICIRGMTNFQRLYDPNRLKYPMRRVGERGSGEWERISWEEAVDAIAKEFSAVQEKFGKEALAVCANSGSLGTISMTSYMDRFTVASGACRIENSYDYGENFGLTRAMGASSMYVQANGPDDLVNARVIILQAANPIHSHINQWRYIQKAMNKGAKLIVIDPKYTQAAAKADIFVGLRPGTDLAFFLGAIKIVIDNGWIDRGYMKKNTNAPYLIRQDNKKLLRLSDLLSDGEDKSSLSKEEAQLEYVVWDSSAGTYGSIGQIQDPELEGEFEINGIKVKTVFSAIKERVAEYTLDFVSEITDVSSETISEVVRLYATEGPSSIYVGYYQHSNGPFLGHAMAILAGLTGMIGKHGAGCGHFRSSASLYGYYSAASLWYPFKRSVTSIPMHYVKEVLESGKFKGKDFPIKAMFLYQENPVTSATNPKHNIIDGFFNKIDFIAAIDIWPTDSTLYADIVLPACHAYERTDFSSSGSSRTTLSEKAVEPAFESKSDLEIWGLVADKMGFGEYFGYTDEEYLDMVTTDKGRENGFSVKDLRVKRTMETGPKEYVSWETGKFGTESGKLDLYCENPWPRLDCGLPLMHDDEQLPYFETPLEAWPETVGRYQKNALADKYPLVFQSNRTRWRIHSQHGNAEWLKELYSEPILEINDIDARARGIGEGDMVRVYNDRGSCVLRATINNGLRPGLVNGPKGFHRSEYVDGCAQELTNDVLDTSSYSQYLYDVLCEVEKR